MKKVLLIICLILVGFFIFYTVPPGSVNATPNISLNGIYSTEIVYSGHKYITTVNVTGENYYFFYPEKDGIDFRQYCGKVIGKDLYDYSGTIKVGYISGNDVHLTGYPTMVKL